MVDDDGEDGGTLSRWFRAPPYIGGGININYVSKGRLRLRVLLVILPRAISWVLRLREFAGTSSRETCFLIDRRYGWSYRLFLLLLSRICEFFDEFRYELSSRRNFYYVLVLVSTSLFLIHHLEINIFISYFISMLIKKIGFFIIHF